MLERNNPKPLYQQLREVLEDGINKGTWKENERIPSENELSSTYGLSRMTARTVLTDMVKEGILYRVPGKGTFVAEQAMTLAPSYIGIREQLEKMGYEVTTRIIDIGEEACDATVAKYLNLPEGTTVFRITRVRAIKEKPISIHISYINTKYSQQLSYELLEKEQLCVLLNKFYGLQRKKMTETLESTVATVEEARLLNIVSGHPLLLLRDVLYEEANIPYEYTKVIFRGDKIKIKLQYE